MLMNARGGILMKQPDGSHLIGIETLTLIVNSAVDDDLLYFQFTLVF